MNWQIKQLVKWFAWGPACFQAPTDVPLPMPGEPGYGTVGVADINAGQAGFLSGLTDIISNVGTTFTNVYRAVNPPSAGSVLYNPRTGLPYPTQAYAPMQFSPMAILFFGLVLVVVIALGTRR